MRLCKNYKGGKGHWHPAASGITDGSLSLQRTTGILTIVFAGRVGRRGKKGKAFAENTSVFYLKKKAEDVVISQNEE